MGSNACVCDSAPYRKEERKGREENDRAEPNLQDTGATGRLLKEANLRKHAGAASDASHWRRKRLCRPSASCEPLPLGFAHVDGRGSQDMVGSKRGAR